MSKKRTSPPANSPLKRNPKRSSVAGDPHDGSLADDLDNVVPSRGYQMTPMVGLGGSAGSIPALHAFFSVIPPDSGMVFVVVLHLSPDHASTLPESLQRFTTMPVHSVEDGVKVEANHVYVIPPGKSLSAVNGHLRLKDLAVERGKRIAVDLFFRSLADTHGPHAAAVVLSGGDGDGAVGIKRIKERGGLTIAQDPEEAEHSSMPRASIDTGMVDWLLKVAEMPPRILAYFKQEKALKLPPEEGPQPAAPVPRPLDGAEAALREVLTYLRTRTGRDFTYYKRATIVRRISRRMQVNGLDDMPGYMEFLRTHPGEAAALLQDLLISVTNFFRDRDAFEALAKKHIPALFKGKGPSDTVRVWVPACATGEEAYSIAILLLEYARKLDHPPALQVLASDLDEQAIQRARAGLYPEATAADISAGRMRHFFVHEAGGYRVRRELREMVLFASHDLLKDAPFSRMDFVSCRNLLIYLSREAQAHALEIFHFALVPGGLLFLGSSESVDERSQLFRVLDKKHRIYAHQPAARVALPIHPVANSRMLMEAQERAHAIAVTHGKRSGEVSGISVPVPQGHRLDRASLSELHFRLIERFSPPSIVINAEHHIMHISETAGRFLQFAGGEPTVDLLRVIHPMLRIELRATLFHAAQTNGPAQSRNVPIDLDGKSCAVDIQVSPAGDIAPGFLLVVLDLREREQGQSEAEEPRTAPEPIVRQLERELEHVKGHLRDTVEQYETSTEELKASNEELQAINEEFRSATEELETSREELQSINEELTTVNQELKGKVDEVAQANSDLQNLMASTSIATIFLDRDLAITRFTPSAVDLFHLIPADVGRPFSHLRHKLEYPEILTDCAHVLRTLTPIERQVRNDGHSYLSRIQPYQTLDNRTAGVVLTFVDVTDRLLAEETLRVSEERLRLLVQSAKDYAIFTTDTERRVTSWNPGAEAMFGYTEKELLGKCADVLFTEADVAKSDPEKMMLQAKEKGVAENERWHRRKDGTTFYGSGSIMPLRDNKGALLGYVKIMRDLTERRQALRVLMASEARQSYLLKLSDALRPLRAPLEIQTAAAQVLGEHLAASRALYAEVESSEDGDYYVVSQDFHSSDLESLVGRHRVDDFGRKIVEEMRAGRTVALADVDTEPAFSDREREAYRLIKARACIGVPLIKDGRHVAIFGVLQSTPRIWTSVEKELVEETAEWTWGAVERARTEAALREATRIAELAIRSKDRMLAVLSHELRTPLTPVILIAGAMESDTSLPEEVRENLAMIRRNIDIETQLIDDLLDATRLKSGKVRLNPRPIVLNEVVKQVCAICSPYSEERQIHVECQLDPLLETIVVDPVRIQQVLWNVLKNAIKFTMKGGKIEATTRRLSDAMCEVRIRDNGIGIRPEVLPHIFEVFEQGDPEITQRFGGLGLGLSISKSLMELHGGSIRAESTGTGEGACFIMELPITAPTTK